MSFDLGAVHEHVCETMVGLNKELLDEASSYSPTSRPVG